MDPRPGLTPEVTALAEALRRRAGEASGRTDLQRRERAVVARTLLPGEVPRPLAAE